MAQISPIDAEFNPNRILDDRDILDIQSSTLKHIQEFLKNKGSLGRYRTRDIDGVEKSAAEIIWRVATSYKINPKYLMALMQKEQSLVEDPNPSQKQFDWATGFAICDSCSMNDPALQEFKGFASQIEWAAKQHREKYLLQMLGRGATIAGHMPGKTTKIDGVEVTPSNQATAMLYSYTPHLHGNLNLWRIWQRWFSLVFPNGMVVRGKTSQLTYLIHFGEKKPFKSRAVAASMIDPEKIVIVEDSQLTSYPTGRSIVFPNYSLVETPNAKRYLLVDGNKRFIAGRKIFLKFGFNEDEVTEVTEADIGDYQDGPDITAATLYPTGLLAKDANAHYWYVEDGVRQLIPDKIFLQLYFKRRSAKLLSTAKLASLTIGDPYGLHDGELIKVKGHPATFVIENGLRRPIPSEAVFIELGWKWKNVVVIPAKILESYPIGQVVNIQPENKSDNQLLTSKF
ncbi:MAG: hypothetical protein Q7N87_01650 [Candidatus Uhrbacteria bacterium]|nr:hypothetical protein [Candidatus Uhrbacteria bacterium]